jgi:hypothetical protein
VTEHARVLAADEGPRHAELLVATRHPAVPGRGDGDRARVEQRLRDLRAARLTPTGVPVGSRTWVVTARRPEAGLSS